MPKLEQHARKVAEVYFSRQFLAFAFAGGFAMAVNWVARWIIDIYLSYGAAVLLAYGVGTITAYVLNAAFVFPSNANERRREITYFVAFNAAALPFVWLISHFLGAALLPKVMAAGQAAGLGHLIAIASPAIVNFAAHKFITFREKT